MHEHPYRTHTCEALRRTDEGTTVRLSGWVHRKRDHGALLFIDLRDHYGITQVVITPESGLKEEADNLRTETVVTFKGQVVPRSEETVNKKLSTGDIELAAKEMTVLGPAETLPITVADEKPYPESTPQPRRMECKVWRTGAREFLLPTDVPPSGEPTAGQGLRPCPRPLP